MALDCGSPFALISVYHDLSNTRLIDKANTPTVHLSVATLILHEELDTHHKNARRHKQSTPRAGEVFHGYSDDVH